MNPRPWIPWGTLGPDHSAHGRIEVRMPGIDYLITGWQVTTRFDPSSETAFWAYHGGGDYVPVPPDAEWRFVGPPVPPAEVTGPTILIWRFDDAPGELQALSTNGGDEDWVALLPAAMKDEWIPWLDVDAFGCCSRDRYEYDGRTVIIGSHA